MSAPGIRKHLRRQSVGLLLPGLVLLATGVAPLAVPALAALLYGLDALAVVQIERGELAPVGFLLTVSLLCVFLGLRRLWRWRRHPDVLALARYGPPEEVVAAVDAELGRPEQVVRFGGVLPTPGRVYLTPSWLVYLPRESYRVGCLRLDSIVRAYRAPSAALTPLIRGQGTAQAVFEDRHGNGFAITDTEADVARLLAEVIARVPWALSRFDEETKPSQTEGSDQVRRSPGEVTG